MSNVPSFAERKQPGVLCLFDVDGTLTPARQQVSDEMLDVLNEEQGIEGKVALD